MSYVPPKAVSESTLAALLAGTGRRVQEDADPQGDLFLTGRSRGSMKIYFAGDTSLLHRPCVAIVGTRKVSPAGAARARRLASELAREGVVVVSGLAMGVDTEAHTACLEVGGRTIAVVGTPLDKATPAANSALQETIYKEHLLISPFAIGSRVQRGNFPRRNQIMAAIADATVVIEASDTSGTLHQSKEAVALGRWLFIARSCAEDPNLKWPSSFLKEPTAKILTSTQDVLERVGTSIRHAPLRVIYCSSDCPMPDGRDPERAEGQETPDPTWVAKQVARRTRGTRTVLVPVDSGGSAFARQMVDAEPETLTLDDSADVVAPRVPVVGELRDASRLRAIHEQLRAKGVRVSLAVARTLWSWQPCGRPDAPQEDTLDNVVPYPPHYGHLLVQLGGRTCGQERRGVGSLWLPWERRGDFSKLLKDLGPGITLDALLQNDDLGKNALAAIFSTPWLMFHGVIHTDEQPDIPRMLRLRRRFFSANGEIKQVHVRAPIVLGEQLSRELDDGWKFASRTESEGAGALADFVMTLVLGDWERLEVPTSRALRTCLLEHLGWQPWGNLYAETRPTESKFSVLVSGRRPPELEARPVRGQGE